MNEKVLQLSRIQHIGDEFRIIGVTALIATAVVWVYLSMNLLWMAAGYFGVLLFISLTYGTIDYSERQVKKDKTTAK
jgi:hypothetical protein